MTNNLSLILINIKLIKSMPNTLFSYYGTWHIRFPPQEDKIMTIALVQTFAKPINTNVEKQVELVIPSVALVKSLYK